MAEVIDTAFVDIRPRFTGFAAETERGIKQQLAGVDVARSLRGVDASGIKGADKASANLGRSLAGVTAQARGASTGLALMGGSAARLGTIGAAGSVGLAAGLALAGKAAVTAAIDFESGVAGIRKTVDATESVITQISEDLQDLSTEIPVASTELLGLAESAGQLGIETAGIVEFTKTVAELGVTTNLASDVAADALARLANITQLPQDQFDNLGSTIVELGNRTASTEAEIVEFALRISGAGHQVGLTQDQILSFGAALASMGINAEAGGSSISTVFSRIASDVAKGGKRLDVFAKTAGQSSEEFAAAFRSRPAEAVVAFIAGLDRITRSGGNVFATLEELGLGGIRIRDTLLRAAGAGDLLSEALDTGAEAWRKNSALQIEAGRRFETTASNIQLAKNEVNALAADLGARLLPSVNIAAKGIRAAAGGIRAGLGAFDSGGFDAVNADLGELITQLDKASGERDRFVESGGDESIAKSMGAGLKEVIVQLDAVGKSLNRTTGGTEKWMRVFSQASPVIAAAIADGIITPAERGAIAVNELGRTFLRALPPDIFAPVAGAVRSGIEDAAAAAKSGAAEVMNNLRFGIEEGVPAAEASARQAGKTIGTSLATGIAEAATAAVAKSNIVADVQDEAINKAIAAGSTGGQLAALKKKRNSLAAAIEKIERIENPSKARVDQRRRLRADLATVTQQIEGVEAGIVADQEAAVAETERKADEAARVRDERDRAVIDLVGGRISGAEAQVSIAAMDDAVRNDLRANANLKQVLKRQIDVVKARVQDAETKNRELGELNRKLNAVKAERRRLLREQREQEREDRDEAAANRADALADAVTIASLRGDERGQEKALNAQIRALNKRIALTKKGTEKRRELVIELETAKRDLRELRKADDLGSDRGGTTLADLFQKQVGITGAAGFDVGAQVPGRVTQGIEDEVTARLAVQDPTVNVRAKVDDSAQAVVTSNDKLVTALDRLAGIITGNAAANAGGGGTSYASVTGQRAAAMGRYWQSRRNAQLHEDTAAGGV